MHIKARSFFKDPPRDHDWYQRWVTDLARLNALAYPSRKIQTSLGQTHVYEINAHQSSWPSLVIFPGFRTSSLFWDFDNNLRELRKSHRIFLVETNGQPCLSDPQTPDIHSNDYGIWAAEVIRGLGLTSASVAGASFGGLVIMKLAIVAPELVQKIILLNPGCLQPFSLTFRNLYYNMLPIFFPSRKNILKFLDTAVFCKPHHALSDAAEKLIVDYEHFALTRFVDKSQKPYQMSSSDLSKVNSEVYLIEGDKDLLFPFEKSIAYARKHIKNLKEVFVLKNTGHGIETSHEAMTLVKQILA